MPKRAHVRVVEKKIRPDRENGRSVKIFGECSSDGRITIDPRQSEAERLDTLCHELLHHINPDATEDAVTRDAGIMSTALWNEGYRRVRQ